MLGETGGILTCLLTHLADVSDIRLTSSTKEGLCLCLCWVATVYI
jgi:hypothetical protein